MYNLERMVESSPLAQVRGAVWSGRHRRRRREQEGLVLGQEDGRRLPKGGAARLPQTRHPHAQGQGGQELMYMYYYSFIMLANVFPGSVFLSF